MLVIGIWEFVCYSSYCYLFLLRLVYFLQEVLYVDCFFQFVYLSFLIIVMVVRDFCRLWLYNLFFQYLVVGLVKGDSYKGRQVRRCYVNDILYFNRFLFQLL